MRVSPNVRMGSGMQQQHTAERTLISQQMQCFRSGFGLGANSTSPLLPQQGFGHSLRRVREEELRESWCLFGFAFPGSMFASWVPDKTK